MDEKLVWYLKTVLYSVFVIYWKCYLFCSASKNDYQLDSKYIFNVVRGKILGSLNALEHDTYSGDCIFQSLNQPLSLNAIADGPKLRLLWAAFRQVEDKAGIVFIFPLNIVVFLLFGRI